MKTTKSQVPCSKRIINGNNGQATKQGKSPSAPASVAESPSQPKRFGRWQYIDDFCKDVVFLVESEDGRFHLAKDAQKNLWRWDMGNRDTEQTISLLTHDEVLQFLMSFGQEINPHTPESFLRLHDILPPGTAPVAVEEKPDPRWPLLELENAQNQSNALAVLLAENMDYHSSGYGGGLDKKNNFGICNLVCATNDRLNAAIDSMTAELLTVKSAGGVR